MNGENMTEKKKRKPSMSPTQLSLKDARESGCLAQVVEKWNPHAKVRQDLFGVIDIVAIGCGRIVGIQATSRANVSSRVEKIRISKEAMVWCESGGTLEVHGWDKHENRWRNRRILMTYDVPLKVWHSEEQ